MKFNPSLRWLASDTGVILTACVLSALLLLFFYLAAVFKYFD
ncbi:MAG: hypothetical protein WBC04_20665 [Candidatus Acidiferrales bacterium]